MSRRLRSERPKRTSGACCVRYSVPGFPSEVRDAMLKTAGRTHVFVELSSDGGGGVELVQRVGRLEVFLNAALDDSRGLLHLGHLTHDLTHRIERDVDRLVRIFVWRSRS